MLLGSAVPGSSLVSFYFLWAILCPHSAGCKPCSKSKRCFFQGVECPAGTKCAVELYREQGDLGEGTAYR